MEIARQMSFLVEQEKDAVFSGSHRTTKEALTSKIEIKSAKKLAKDLFFRASKKRKGGTGGAQEECVPQERKPQEVEGDCPCGE